MILEAVFSCSNLLLVCGSSIYVLVKHSYKQYSLILSRFAYASAGIAMIGARSLIVLLYKLFFKEYTFDPMLMAAEEERNKERFNALDEALGTLSMAGIIYSLYSCHGYYVIGICVVISLSILDMLKLYRMVAQQAEETEMAEFQDSTAPPFESYDSYRSRINIISWVILGGYVAYVKGNNYAVVANYPLLLANWALSPEGFYQVWTTRHIINDYLMATYVICMTQALKQTNV